MNEANETKTGACLCGQIKFTVEGKALWNTVCYCLNCRRRTGSALYTASICPKNSFVITDGSQRLSSFADTTTDSGKPLTRTFCSNCGSNLFSFTPLNEDIVSISAGAFDNFEEWKPTLEQYCIHRPDFLEKVRDVDRRYVEAINGEQEEEAKAEPAT